MIKDLIQAKSVLKRLDNEVYVRDLFKFNVEILGVESGDDAVPLSEAHREICKFIDENKKKYKLLLVPRGHLKSTLVTVGRTVQRICENPKTRILIANATYGLATAFLDQIKAHLKGNKKLHEQFGDFSKNSSRWSENAIKVYEGEDKIDYEKRENTVTCAGVGGSLTSQHYDMIICDDLVNRENVTTIEQIKKVIRFYMDCLDLLEPGGELIIIGTRWHDMDLYGWIMEGDSETKGQIPKKISKEIMPYQFVYKGEDFDIMKRKIVEGGSAIWPKKFTKAHIKRLKRQKSPYEFSTQYNNEPVASEDQEFKKEWFRYYGPDDIVRRNMSYFTMCDPAISQLKTADYTVFATIAVDEYMNWFVEDIIREHLTPNEIIQTMFRVYAMYKPVEMGIETFAFQKMLSFSIREEMRLKGINLPLREIKPTNKVSKETRIKSLQPGYFNGKIFHKTNMKNLDYLEDELLRFPLGSYDDIIDALAGLTEFAFPPKSHSKSKRSSKYLY